MDIKKFKDFQEAVLITNQLNNGRNIKYIILKDNVVTFLEEITLYDLINFDFIIALGVKITHNGRYQNSGGILLGMFDKNFDLARKITLENGWSITNIRFTKYKESWYDTYKPILVVKSPIGEEKEISVEKSWDKAFPEIIEEAKNL